MHALIERLSRPTTGNAALFLSMTSACWSGNFIIGRWAPGHIPPLTLSFARWGLASLIMLVFAARHLRKDWPQVRAHLPLLALLGVTGAGIFNALQYVALVYTSATSGAVINSASPILIVLACTILFGDRVGLAQMAGIAVSLAGVLTVIGKGSLPALAALGFNVGDLLMLLAMVFGSVYAAYIRQRPAIHPLSFAFVTFSVAAIVNVPLMGAELAMGARIDLSPSSLLAMAYVGSVQSVIAYLCYNRGLEILGGARAGVFLHLIPLFTSLLAVVFLGEQPRLYHAAGFALILAGIWLTASRGGV